MTNKVVFPIMSAASPKPPLTVGDELYFLDTRRRGGTGRQVTVVLVGRKWAILSNRERADIRTWIVDGGGHTSPGSLYVSKEAFDNEVSLSEAWQKLRREIDRAHAAPAGLTLDGVEQIRRSIFDESTKVGA